jgi:cation:H+ antiporter
MLLPLAALAAGLAALLYAADRFVDGAAATSRHLGVPALLIGMVIVGFGTSAPELLVSGLAAADGAPGVALGNAYGSNIANIALILGVTALVAPITVRSRVLRRELPILLAVTAVAALQLVDGTLTRLDAAVLLTVFGALMGWTIAQGRRDGRDALADEVDQELAEAPLPLRGAIVRLALGLGLLIVASRVLVWGAVRLAEAAGVPDLIIGLTIVAIGTSLPELASALAAARKGEHDLALGNVLGSNLFNTLAVVGLAAAIRPIDVAPEVLTRDVAAMGGATVALALFGLRRRGPGRLNRVEGAVLVAAYAGYLGWLAWATLQG